MSPPTCFNGATSEQTWKRLNWSLVTFDSITRFNGATSEQTWKRAPLGAACRIAVCSLLRERVPETGSPRTARISVVRRKFLALKRFRSARGGLVVFSSNIRIIKEFVARIEQHDEFTTTPLATGSAQIEDTAKHNLSEMAGHDSHPWFVLSCQLSFVSVSARPVCRLGAHLVLRGRNSSWPDPGNVRKPTYGARALQFAPIWVVVIGITTERNGPLSEPPRRGE
jgi:hypothetical protein